jgi:initiation factor 1A
LNILKELVIKTTMPKKTNNKPKKKVVTDISKRAVEKLGDNEYYAHITRMIGDGQTNAILTNGNIISPRIAGSMKRRGKKRMWVSSGSVVIVSKRSFGKDAYDIVHAFNAEECQHLVKIHEIPPLFLDNSSAKNTDEVTFMDDDMGDNVATQQSYSNVNMYDDSDSDMSEELMDELGNLVDSC